MMRKNEELPDIEKLSRHEFDLDVDEQARLQAEGEAEIEKVKLTFIVAVLAFLLSEQDIHASSFEDDRQNLMPYPSQNIQQILH